MVQCYNTSLTKLNVKNLKLNFEHLTLNKLKSTLKSKLNLKPPKESNGLLLLTPSVLNKSMQVLSELFRMRKSWREPNSQHELDWLLTAHSYGYFANQVEFKRASDHRFTMFQPQQQPNSTEFLKGDGNSNIRIYLRKNYLKIENLNDSEVLSDQASF